MNHEVIVESVPDLGRGVLEEVVVNEELVDHEVEVEGQAERRRDEPLRGGRLEVDKLDDGRHGYVHDSYLVDLVHNREDLRAVSFVPALLLCAVGDNGCSPAERYQEGRQINVEYEETCLPCPLEPPVHRVRRE